MTCFVGLDISQKMKAICVVDHAGRRLWRGRCTTVPARSAFWSADMADGEVMIGLGREVSKKFFGAPDFDCRRASVSHCPCGRHPRPPLL